jgi:pilus assembly protein CpaF
VSSVDQIKVELHRRLVERLDLAALERIKDQQVLLAQIRQAVLEFLRSSRRRSRRPSARTSSSRSSTRSPGLGPIEPLFRDPTISDILVNGPKDVYVERAAGCRRPRSCSATTRTCCRSSTAS